MSIEVIVPEANKKSYERMRFAPAVHHDGLIFCSGVIGTGDSAEDEFRNAWQEIGRLLEHAGVGFEDVIDTTLYMVDLQKNAATMFAVKNEFIEEPYPASTWIGITELVIPGARAEIKVIARKR
jgi:enamine deaminase RidA (YjgF/YER057c/UK114 family)